MSTWRITLNRIGALAPLALAAVAVSGCATRVAVERPEIALPAAFDEPNPEPLDAQISQSWWRAFNSPQLTDWLETSLDESSDLRIAAERVRQAELALRITRGSRFPDLGLSLGSSTSSTESSGQPTTDRDSSSVGLSVGYELDLWGRIAADVRAGRAVLDATRYDYDALRLSLATTVASTYFQLLSLDARLTIARENLAIAERVLGIVNARYRNGVATPLDVSQQNTTVLNQRTALMPLEVQARQTRTALALLLGRVPQNFGTGAESFAELQVPEVGAGLPSMLLTRRPDLAAAEADLVTAAADVGIARSVLLPSISLSGSRGQSSADLLSLTDPSTSLSAGIQLALSLFNGGRLRAQVESARSQQRIATETYAATVRSALKEIDDGLGNASLNARQESVQQETVVQAQRTLQLAEVRYREGSSDLLTVLDSQRVLFNAQDQLASLRLGRLNAALDLYKALGGGWTR